MTSSDDTVDMIAASTAATYRPTIHGGKVYSTISGSTFCAPLPSTASGCTPASVKR